MHSTLTASPNRIRGSLAEMPLSRLLAHCQRSAVTGRIDLTSGANRGRVVLRAGMVDSAEFGGTSGDDALEEMRQLSGGSYEISQRLPDLDGVLGPAAAFRGELSDVPLVRIMRHCEGNALTCTVVVIREFDRGEVVYRAGEIADVRLNGRTDEDALVEMVRWTDARFLVSAPPLTVTGRPVPRRHPTEPFRLEHLRRLALVPQPGEPQPAEPEPEAEPAPLAELFRRRVGEALRRLAGELGRLAERVEGGSSAAR